MNIAKNMEAIFIATAILAGATSIATASTPVPRIVIAADTVAVKADVKAAVQPRANAMQVVTISAKRLTAAEKAAL